MKLEALGSEETYGMVLRAKGMVESDRGEWIYFDMVPVKSRSAMDSRIIPEESV